MRAIWIIPRPSTRWERLVDRWCRWRWRKHGGLSPRWQTVGLYDPEKDE